MAHDRERAEAAVLDEVDARREAVDLRVIPRDREEDRRVEQHAEVVGVGRVLVEVADIGDEPAAERLLDADFDLIARARRSGTPAVPNTAASALLASTRFSLYGVSSVRPYDARSIVPLPGTA